MKKRRKERKAGKGLMFRPCIKCGGIVNFIPWPEEAERRGSRVWHWANEDGSHHTCNYENPASAHIRSILQEDLTKDE